SSRACWGRNVRQERPERVAKARPGHGWEGVPVRILGIDPGTALSGFGVIEGGHQPRALDYGAIRTPAGMPEAERLLHIHARVRELITALEPDVLAVEQVFFNKNTR